MEIFLLRHAEAGSAPRDAERQLTARGRRELLSIISGSAEALVNVTQIWVSPYTRAQQTLELARPYLPDTARVTTSELLTPEQPPLSLWRLLESGQAQSCLLVSHQPLLGEFLNALCGLSPGEYAMGTSALAAVDCETLAAGQGRLRWLRQP